MASTAARLDAAQVEDKSNLRRVVAASFIGTTIEWYDFFLYGTAAALVFGELFFPNVESADRHAGGVRHVRRRLRRPPAGRRRLRSLRRPRRPQDDARPVAADHGPRDVPDRPACRRYDSIGIAAPILLVLLRFAQGIGVGGEWGGAVLMAVEHAPKGKRGFFGSWPQMGVPAGLLLSTVVFTAGAERDHRGRSSWPGAGASRSWSRSCSSRSASSSA